jgi:hypothetical protein
MQSIGVDRVLYAVDYPYEKMSEAAEWFDKVDIVSESDWNKIARTNAGKLFKLNTASTAKLPLDLSRRIGHRLGAQGSAVQRLRTGKLSEQKRG